jgi:hypothetical protein
MRAAGSDSINFNAENLLADTFNLAQESTANDKGRF